MYTISTKFAHPSAFHACCPFDYRKSRTEALDFAQIKKWRPEENHCFIYKINKLDLSGMGYVCEGILDRGILEQEEHFKWCYLIAQ